MKLANSAANHSDSAFQTALKDDLKFVAMVWLLSHLWITIFAYLGHISHPFQEYIVDGFQGVSNWYLNVWTTFDSEYFLEIARNGYTAKSSTFFPLYPLLLRPFGPDENLMAFAGVLISNLAFFIALYFFLDLTRYQYNEKTARASLWILAFFPVAIFGMAVYTESLFLMFGVLTFWCIRRDRWHWGVLWCVLAALTRNSGPLFTIMLLFEWWSQRKSGKNPPIYGLCVALLPMLIFIAVQLTFKNQFGDSLSSITNQSHFYRQVMFPLIPVWRDFVNIITNQGLNLVSVSNLLATLGAFALIWRNRTRVPIADLIFLAGILLLQLTFARINPPYTNSSLRYLFTTWPFIQMLALEWDLIAANRMRLIIIASMVLMTSAANSFIFGKKFFLG